MLCFRGPRGRRVIDLRLVPWLKGSCDPEFKAAVATLAAATIDAAVETADCRLAKETSHLRGIWNPAEKALNLCQENLVLLHSIIFVFN